MASPPVSLADSQIRCRELLLALYRHPLTTEQLLALNPTYTFPFPAHEVRRRFKDGRIRSYREARTLTRLLSDLMADGRVAQAHYATAGRGQRPYYLLTEAGFTFLFPDQPVPKKHYRAAATNATKSRQSTFFRPIPLATQDHDEAVGRSVVHTLVQAKRDGIHVDAYHTRNRVELKIPTVHALGCALKPMVRLDAVTGEPVKQYLSLFPDATLELLSSTGNRFLRFDEIDGGTESVLSREEEEAIERKVRFYDHYADIADRRFRVRFLTYRPRSFGRLQSVMACVRSVLRNPDRPLFLFATLEHYLDCNGALTRNCFLDHFGRPVPCIPRRGSARVPGLRAIARGLAESPRPSPRDRATSTVDPKLSTLAAAAPGAPHAVEPKR